MDEVPVERETVVVDSGSRGGSGGAIAAILVVLVLGVLAFLYFGGHLGRAIDKGDVNVNVNLPKVELPPIHIDNPAPSQSQPQQPATNQSGK